jgi:hypothetical protein
VNGEFQAKAAGRGGALASLLTVRRAEEERAERALAEAVDASARVAEESLRLAAATAAARAALVARRVATPETESGAEALARRRFFERLEVVARACEEAVTSHARDREQPAARAEAAARAAHLRARTRRELVERAMARREEARRRDLDRRAEAAVDDLRHDRARRTRDDC